MAYALFCNDAKLSKAYPTEADVWKFARQSGLVVDVATEDDKPAPRPVLDNDYEIRPCQPDPREDPEQNKAEAERQALKDLQFERDEDESKVEKAGSADFTAPHRQRHHRNRKTAQES